MRRSTLLAPYSEAWLATFQSGVWSAWENLGGAVVGGLTGVSTTTRQVELFAVDMGGHVVHMSLEDTVVNRSGFVGDPVIEYSGRRRCAVHLEEGTNRINCGCTASPGPESSDVSEASTVSFCSGVTAIKRLVAKIADEGSGGPALANRFEQSEERRRRSATRPPDHAPKSSSEGVFARPHTDGVRPRELSRKCAPSVFSKYREPRAHF